MGKLRKEATTDLQLRRAMYLRSAMNSAELLLAHLRTQIANEELDRLAMEAGFVEPNQFDFENMTRPLRNLSFPLDNAYEYMWAIYECGLPRLVSFSPPLRQYIASIYLSCNRQCIWGMTVQGDYYYLLTQATLQNRSSLVHVMAWLETLAESANAAQGFDPRFARFCWVTLDNATHGESASVRRLEFAKLLHEPATPSLMDELNVCETTAETWKELYESTLNAIDEDGFGALFFGKRDRSIGD
jgi:hypothetical protein